MNKAILIAHGCGGQPSFSIPKVKTITRAGEELTSFEAYRYLLSKKTFPEYSSTSFGNFTPLTDDQCNTLLGSVPYGKGIINTGYKKGNDLAGVPIYVLRNKEVTASYINKFMSHNSITSLVIVACRN